MYVVPLFSRLGVDEVDKASFSKGRKKELLQVADYLIHFLKHVFVLFLRKRLFGDSNSTRPRTNTNDGPMLYIFISAKVSQIKAFLYYHSAVHSSESVNTWNFIISTFVALGY